MSALLLAFTLSAVGGILLARARPPVPAYFGDAAASGMQSPQTPLARGEAARPGALAMVAAVVAVLAGAGPGVVVVGIVLRVLENAFPGGESVLAAVGGLCITAVVVHAVVRQRGQLLRRPPRIASAYLEKPVAELMRACAAAAVLVTFGIVFSVLFESVRFFRLVSPAEFLFGLEWSPQIALRAEQVASGGRFGIVPLLAGTFLISAVALVVATPLGLAAAVWLSEFASRKTRAVVKPILEMLTGVPTVVYGVFAAVILAPKLRGWFSDVGVDASPESALAAGLVMGVMIMPFVASLAEDALAAVPARVRDGALAMGSTKAEAAVLVQVPAATPGIVAGILLAASRAVGETMIVVMAAGLSANLTANPLEAVTTVTVQIVTLLTGDQEFDSPKTLAAFALGLALFAVTLVFNVVALRTVRKYREGYDS